MAERKRKTKSTADAAAEQEDASKIITGESYKGAVFERVDLDGAVFNAGNLYCVAVIGSNFDQTRIEECSMQNAQFRNMGMKNASFQAMDMHGAIFSNADLRDSKIMHLDMSNTGFSHLNLSGAAFDHCVFGGAKFDVCDWADAEIDGIPVKDLLAAYQQLHNN